MAAILSKKCVSVRFTCRSPWKNAGWAAWAHPLDCGPQTRCFSQPFLPQPGFNQPQVLSWFPIPNLEFSLQFPSAGRKHCFPSPLLESMDAKGRLWSGKLQANFRLCRVDSPNLCVVQGANCSSLPAQEGTHVCRENLLLLVAYYSPLKAELFLMLLKSILLSSWHWSYTFS